MHGLQLRELPLALKVRSCQTVVAVRGDDLNLMEKPIFFACKKRGVPGFYKYPVREAAVPGLSIGRD
jgi:hypothetical protein